MKDKYLFLATLIFSVCFILLVIGIFTPLNVIASPFVTTLVLVYLLNPFVKYLKGRGISAKISTLIIGAGIILIAVFIIIFLLPKAREAVEHIIGISETFFDKTGIRISTEFLSSGVGVAYTTAVNAVKTVAVFTVGAVAAFYILSDYENVKTSLTEFVPDKLKSPFKILADDIKMIMDSFFKGQIVVAAILAVMDSIILYAIGVPYALGLGVIAGILDIIPYAGAFISMGIIVFITLISVPDKVLWVFIGLLIIQQVENNFITPKVSKDTLNLHPAAVVLFVYVGAFGGFWGILLSVPFACILKKFFQRFIQAIV